jgi:putative ABC transport system permease protein
MESNDRLLQDFKGGDAITIETANGPLQLTISGTARTLGRLSPTFSSSARAYMSATALEALDGHPGPTDVLVQVVDKSREKETLKQLSALLTAHNVKVTGADTIDDYWDPGIIAGLFTILRVLSAIALLLTGFLIINTVTKLVAEQIKIIGTMKAVGATRGAILRSYLTSVGIYGAVGTALGIALGLFGGYQFTAFLASIIVLDLGPVTLSPGIMLTSVVVGLGVPFLAALLPLWSGTRSTVREAMAAYGVGAPGGGAAARLAQRLTWVPQTTWLGLRGLFRRRGRAILTLLALTLSGTVFLAVQTTNYSINAFIEQFFSQYDFDAYVGTKALPYNQIRAQLLAIPDVARVERFEQDVVQSQWGSVLLTGVEEDTQLYHHAVLAGRWLHPGEQNALVISDALANATGKRVGDTLAFSSATNKATWVIVGEVHDLDGGLGLQGVMLTSIANMHAFEQLDPNQANSFLIQAADRSPAAVNQMANTLDDTLSRAGLAPFVSTAQQQVQRNRNQFQILSILLSAVAAIVALVGVLGLFNTLTTSVLERRREIGILRSMGATGWRVASIFWTEGLALASISWLVAAVIGLPAAFAFVTLISKVLLPIPFAFDPMALLVTLAFILGIALLASIIPALGAARVRIADTLRYE